MLNLRKGHEPKKEIELPCHISFVWNLTLAPLFLRNGRKTEKQKRQKKKEMEGTVGEKQHPPLRTWLMIQ